MRAGVIVFMMRVFMMSAILQWLELTSKVLGKVEGIWCKFHFETLLVVILCIFAQSSKRGCVLMP